MANWWAAATKVLPRKIPNWVAHWATVRDLPVRRVAGVVGGCARLARRSIDIGQAARLEDAPLPVIEHGERFAQRLAAVVRFLALGEPPR